MNDDYNKYFYNSIKGILFNKLFYYSTNEIENYNYIDDDKKILIKENLSKLKNSIIYCCDYNNKIEDMCDNDIHWEFTDFIINTAKFHKKIDNSIEMLNDIKLIREEIEDILDNYNVKENELINYIKYIFDDFKIIINNKKDIYNNINNYTADIILDKFLNIHRIKDYNYIIENFVKKIINKYNIIYYKNIVNNLLIFLRYIINTIIVKIKDIYYYNTNNELINSIDIECSFDSLNYYIKENKYIIIGILIRDIKDSYKDKYKYNNLSNKYSQAIYNNIYKGKTDIPNNIIIFYNNYINIINLNNNNNLELENNRLNLKKKYIGDKYNLFSKLIPEIKNDNKYKIWYTNNNNKKDYIEINKYYNNTNILRKIYNKILISNNNKIKILNNEMVFNNNIKYDVSEFNININKILKKLYYNCNLNYSIILTKNDNIDKKSAMLCFINKDMNIFLYLLYNNEMNEIKNDIYNINYYTCYKILINYNIELYTDYKEVIFENILMWKEHTDNMIITDKIMDIHKLKDNIFFLKYMQLLINYVNNNLHKINLKKNKLIYIKDIKKIKDTNILKNTTLYNNIFKLKHNIEQIKEIIYNLNKKEYKYDIYYENIFLIRKLLIENGLVEFKLSNSYKYFEYLISVIFLEYNKFSINVSVKECINKKLNEMKKIKTDINNNNINLILFLKLINIYNNSDNTILNIKNFNIILKEKTVNIINITNIKLDILNIILENEEILI
jgi:hypothetical protein